jgi:hypothetical protein
MTESEDLPVVVEQPDDESGVPMLAPETNPYRLAAERAAPEAIQLLLNRQMDDLQVEIREDGVVYLPASIYRDRLFEAFGSLGWAMVPVSLPKVDGNKVLYHGRLYCHSRFVAEKIGEHEYYEKSGQSSWSESVDAAESECLKKCCKNLIPGFLPLWDKGWILWWQAKYAVQVWRKPKPGKDNKPCWRRKDRPAFWDETGFVKEQKQHKPVQEGQSAARGAAGLREDMGLDVKEDDPVATEARRQRFDELMNLPVPVELEGIREAIGLADKVAQLKDKRLTDQVEAMKNEDKATIRSWWAIRHKEITEGGGS